MKVLVIFCLLFVGCGKIEHKVKGVDNVSVDPIVVGVDYKSIAEFCDDRYGKGTDESEECYQDLVNFSTVELKLDLESIESYCADNYDTEEEIKACEEELLGFINTNN